MNKKIEDHYRNLISVNLEYLECSSIRSSLEDYKSNLLKETENLPEQHLKQHNMDVLNEYYQDSIGALEEGEEDMNKQINSIIEKFKSSDEQELTEMIAAQIIESTANFKLKDDYDSFNGILFEFDDGPGITGLAFKEPSFEVLLEQAKYIKFQDGNYACDYPLEFILEDFLGPILNEEYEEIVWAFEYELDIFLKLKEIFYFKIAICLNKAFSKESLITRFDEIGFEKNGVVYLNEHDMEARTVYFNV